MDRDEIVRAWHYLRFINECLRRTGTEFQSFFEDLMEKVDPAFVRIKPSGQEGDWKSDGWLPGSGTCFQVYAPEELTVATTVAKIEADFAGALAKWNGDLKSWIFVWSARQEGLPAAVLNCLNKLSEDNEEIEIDQWGRERLWQQCCELPEADRTDLLGPVPEPAAVTATTDHEVQSLLTYIAEQPIPDLDSDLELVSLEEKMDRNDFGEGVRLLIKAAMPIVPTVEHYVSNHPDQRFSQRVAVSLGERYEEMTESLDGDANAIFGGLLDRISGAATPETKERWAAVAIVAHYFELCDIFER
ncbi:MAG TPA: ABC-three component system protein [Solirubrobacterales bacterium]|nr:ABC-three component system protein [Solirubrobacterales bacterium]